MIWRTVLLGVLLSLPTEKTFQFGVGIHVGMNRNGLPETQRALVHAGVNTFRDEVFWHRLETKPGTLTFPDSLKDLDQLVTETARRGGRPLLILNYGNKLYDGGGLIHSPQGIAGYVRYVRFVVEHFRGRVDQFEIWNEWNIGGGGTPAQRAARYGSPEDYAALLRAAYTAVKSENPSATVIGGAFAGYDYKWIDAFARAGGFQFLDGFSIHPYVFSEGRSGTPESAMRHLDELKARIDALAPGRVVPLYITEAGWPVHQGSNGVSEQTAAAYLRRFMLLAKSRPWIAGVWWYDLFDDGEDATNKEHRFGLLTRTGAPKPAFQALTEIQSELAAPR
jgi:polysaccharide biosynthesis protein PslG